MPRDLLPRRIVCLTTETVEVFYATAAPVGLAP